MRTVILSGLCVGALALVGCATAERPDISGPPVPLPEAFGEGAGGGSEAADRWWTQFEDPQLETLVDEAMAQNLDLRQSWARLEQFIAIADQQGSLAWPSVSLDASTSRRRAYDFTGNAIHADNFSLSAAASYEVDLWGRIGALDDAAMLDIQASREDTETFAMSLAAQVAETWYSIVEQKAQLDLLQNQIEINKQFLELIELRFSVGQASALDIYQQRQQLLATEAQIPLTRSRLIASQNQLSLLLSKPVGRVEMADVRTLPQIQALPEVGVPSDLLKRRPDLRSAWIRVASADKRVAAAVADQFPSIRLTAQLGFQDDNLGELLENWIWSLVGNLTLPLLDGGRRAAEVDRNIAVLEERLGRYGQVTLQAFKEVEDALMRERTQREVIAMTDQQLELANDTLREARVRYTQGLTDYLPVLGALRTLQQTEQNRLSAQRQLISFRIQLHRALGGDWTEALESPFVSAQDSDEEP